LTSRDPRTGPHRTTAAPALPGSDGLSARMAAPGVAAIAHLGQGLAEAVDPDLDWDQQARCRSHDPVLFFGPNRFEPKRERLAREAEAKAVCATCPCLRACREYALTSGELYGVWGGLGEADRREILAEGSVATAV